MNTCPPLRFREEPAVGRRPLVAAGLSIQVATAQALTLRPGTAPFQSPGARSTIFHNLA